MNWPPLRVSKLTFRALAPHQSQTDGDSRSTSQKICGRKLYNGLQPDIDICIQGAHADHTMCPWLMIVDMR